MRRGALPDSQGLRVDDLQLRDDRLRSTSDFFFDPNSDRMQAPRARFIFRQRCSRRLDPTRPQETSEMSARSNSSQCAQALRSLTLIAESPMLTDPDFLPFQPPSKPLGLRGLPTLWRNYIETIPQPAACRPWDGA
jgi:hypothetical protein